METQVVESQQEIHLDETLRALVINGTAINLGPREYQILSVLWQRKETVLSRQQILDLVDSQIKIFDRSIDSVISHIRKKLRRFQPCSLQILGVYGKGYKLTWRQNNHI